MLWVAHFRGAQVSRWNPRTGEKIASYPIPTYNVTCSCFGGARMDELFVTTASVLMEGASDEQKTHAGALFRMKPGVAGKEAFKFGG
jgi:sugar lactone lactonase YvrE